MALSAEPQNALLFVYIPCKPLGTVGTRKKDVHVYLCSTRAAGDRSLLLRRRFHTSNTKDCSERMLGRCACDYDIDARWAERAV